MAVRREELDGWIYEVPSREASVYSFPSSAVRRRIARQRRVALARRRLAAVGVVIALVVGFMLASGPGGGAAASRPGTPRAITVHSGDTLWDLASRYAPDSVDPRAYVDAIQELNGLEGAPQTGARLKLPR